MTYHFFFLFGLPLVISWILAMPEDWPLRKNAAVVGVGWVIDVIVFLVARDVSLAAGSTWASLLLVHTVPLLVLLAVTRVPFLVRVPFLMMVAGPGAYWSAWVVGMYAYSALGFGAASLDGQG